MNGAVRVMIVEDQAELRCGLASLVDRTPGFTCVGTFDRIEAALQEVNRIQPSLSLIDLELPGISGTDGIRALRTQFPNMPILALTIHDQDERVFEALCAGASGYLLKNMPVDRLVAALNEAMAGGAPMSPEVASCVVRLFREFKPAGRATYHLTGQEAEILRLLVEGHHYKTAANVLNISVNTVAFHLKNIYTKLQVHSKTEAVAKAIRERLV